MSRLDHVARAPVDPIFGLQAEFKADSRADKINLSIGIYQTAELQTLILASVKEAELRLLHQETSKTYLPIDGEKRFVDAASSLIFGEELKAHLQTRLYGIQAVGGTGALFLAGAFLKQELDPPLFVSNPTWPNHHGIFKQCGLTVAAYPYLDPKGELFDSARFFEFVKELPEGSILVLHAACHNPTSFDPSLDEWEELSALCLRKKLFPLFDFAYQGFGEGVEEDAAAVRLFAKNGHEMFVAASYSKNFGLYSERVGALYLITASQEVTEKSASQLRRLARSLYSNPPSHGERIVSLILNSPDLRRLWEEELRGMRFRIATLRNKLAEGLRQPYLQKSRGMFCQLPLTKEKIVLLRSRYGIYLTMDGRINLAGLNEINIDRVIEAIVTL